MNNVVYRHCFNTFNNAFPDILLPISKKLDLGPTDESEVEYAPPRAPGMMNAEANK
jgi:hypothetical protein